ncbi:MAG: hypothetical protein ACHRXM_32760 [Isosphaerales bacterium]
MFPITRPFRQTLATLLLFALSVLPTGFVAAIGWRINRPGHVRDVEIELGRQLGLQVTLEEVRYPRPGEVVYRGIVLRQEEPRGKGLAEIIRADQVRVQRAKRELTILLESPRLRAESPRQILSQLGALMQRSVQIPFERISVTAASGEVDLGGEDLHFTPREVAGEFLADPSTPTLKLAYRMPAGGADTRCELTLCRDRRSEPIQTSLVLQTVEGLPLPARVLNVFFDAEDWLGAEAKVEGTLSLRQAGSKDWEAEFQGDLLDVDLGKLVGRRFPRHRLTGRGRVAIRKARWGARPDQGSGWVEAKGDLLVGQGSIGVNLIDALAREMKFRPSSRLAHLDPRKTEVDFRALGLSFAMQPDGEIQIAGALGAEFPPDVVLAGATTPLLSAPQGTASVHGLIKTLFPVFGADTGVLIPLTAESHVLLSLPVPRVTVSKAVEGN